MYFCSKTNEPGKSSEQQTEIAYELDLRGNFTALNRAAAVFSGYSGQELRRMNIAELLAPECVLPMQHHLKRSVRERFGTVWEVEIVAKDGCRLRLETSAHVVIREGEPVAIIGIAYPISPEYSTSQIATRGRECEVF